jgi:predicted nucleic acid-binding Zn ribbon protein
MARRVKNMGIPVRFSELDRGRRPGALLGEAISVGRLAGRWSGIVGASLAARTVPYRMQRNVLTVHVSDSPLLQELSFCRGELLAKIQEHAPELPIQNLRFKIGILR